MPFMFQLSGVGLVRMAKTRFEKRERNNKKHRQSSWSFPLPFSGYDNSYSGVCFGTLHCVSNLFPTP